MQQVKGFVLGALVASAYLCRRGIAREWRFAVRDFTDMRAELARHFG